MSELTRPLAHADQAAVLLQIAKAVGSGRVRLAQTLRGITEAGAAALDVERCGIWMYDGTRSSIRCVDLYEASKHRHSDGTLLEAADYPRYFGALAKERVIAAGDAVSDARTSEFDQSYLKPLGIGAMLDAPVWGGGGVVGIVCHEHVGPRRPWTEAEQSFSGALADLVSLALESDRRTQLEAELRRREAHLRTLSMVAHDVVYELDDQGRYLHVSPNVERILGWRPEELLMCSVREFLHPDDVDQCSQGLGRVRVGQPPVTVVARHMRRDGSECSFECSLTAYNDEAGQRRVVVSSRDVTARLDAERESHELQARLARGQRLEAVGRLAGGIAHDFNNMLTVITSAAEDLLVSLPEGQAAREHALQIAEAADRSAALTRQLLVFSSREMLRQEVLNATGLVTDLERMLRRVIGEDVRLELELDQRPAWVRVDPAQLEQVLVNLAVNARDAMPTGGVLTLSVARRQLTRSPPELLDPISPGDWVELRVSDTGSGIDPAMRERVFDPFFTTKEPGQGTGLGLSTVYGVLRQLGGAVGLQSRLGEGSAFSLWLPLHELPPEPADPAPSSAPSESRAAHILLVEDERLVRDLVAECLVGAGHRVVVAATPAEALELAAEHDGFDLMLSDVVMPGMSGVELWQRLKQRWPALPVVFMSGYPDRASTGQTHVPEGATFLGKPFRPSDLVSCVVRALPTPG